MKRVKFLAYLLEDLNEISFVENQVISNIVQTSQDWWCGKNVAGKSGLFPAQYVQLVEPSRHNSLKAGSKDVSIESFSDLSFVPSPPATLQRDRSRSKLDSNITAIALYDYITGKFYLNLNSR